MNTDAFKAYTEGCNECTRITQELIAGDMEKDAQTPDKHPLVKAALLGWAELLRKRARRQT